MRPCAGEDQRKTVTAAPHEGADKVTLNMNAWQGIVWALAPTVLVGLVFWWVMAAIVRADRTERKVYAKIEAEERAKRGLPSKN
ncbi:hypothetical protein GCM10022288_21560 [Gryllotalpicola kribbensis]|uniref:Lysyl-tRNA synthetase n=2 Tax=Gryllotalpicola kribbensis TaxID=993084 RepID=A0ABP8AUX9_9MICO